MARNSKKSSNESQSLKSPLLANASPSDNDAIATSTENAVEDDPFYMDVPKSILYSTDREYGLTEKEAETRLEKFGKNALEEKVRNKWVALLLEFVKPMPIMIWIAIVIECSIKDWENVAVLFTLQLLNAFVGWYEDTKAGDAVAALRASLKPEAYVRRDGSAKCINAADIVPGDIVLLTAGNTVPADSQIIVDGENEKGKNKPVQIDQAALTGESLPVTLHPGDTAMMGSQVVMGEVDAIVTATGSQTFFGKTASMISSVDEIGHFQKVVLQITFGLMSISFILCGICLVYLLMKHNDVLDSLAFCVVLLVASIPIAMQVVCTTTMALGCKKVKKNYSHQVLLLVNGHI